MLTHKLFIGIGSNIGDRLNHLQEAVERLDLIEETRVCEVSSVYMTEPVGEIEQNRFYNAVLLLETTLSPEELRQQCKTIELELGRPDAYPRWSPRVIDLDILLCDDLCIHTEILSIPHPELHRRKFVLIPMLDIANPMHPETQKSILQHLEQCSDQSVLIRIRESIRIKKGRSSK